MIALSKSNKGSVSDIVYNISALLSAGIVIVLMYILIVNFNLAWQDNVSVATESKDAMDIFAVGWPNWFDWLFTFFLVTLMIGIVLVGARLQADPKFLPLFIIVSIVLVICSAFFANFWQEFSEDESIISYSSNFPKMNWVFEHFALVILFMCVLSAISMYANPGNIGGGGM